MLIDNIIKVIGNEYRHIALAQAGNDDVYDCNKYADKAIHQKSLMLSEKALLLLIFCIRIICHNPKYRSAGQTSYAPMIPRDYRCFKTHFAQFNMTDPFVKQKTQL